MAERIGREELRALIREALKEALGAAPVPPPSRTGEEPAAPQRNADYRLTSGVLTETKVAAIARTYTKIVVGSGVAITPLARDKARELKIGIERQKP